MVAKMFVGCVGLYHFGPFAARPQVQFRSRRDYRFGGKIATTSAGDNRDRAFSILGRFATGFRGADTCDGLVPQG